MTITHDRDYAFRRHEVSMHEAGHVVMWRVLGFPNAEGHIWPVPDAFAEYGQKDGPYWAGAAGPEMLFPTDYLGPLQARMIGVAGSIAQMLYRWRTIGDDAYYDGGRDRLTDYMSEGDWEVGQFKVSPLALIVDRPLWRRAVTLVQKRFDPDIRGDLWLAVCKTAADIRRRNVLSGPPDEVQLQEIIRESNRKDRESKCKALEMIAAASTGAGCGSPVRV
jgi:hypothetical protein